MSGTKKIDGVQRSRGFSLIEMCIVLTIAAVILASAAHLYRIYLKANYQQTDEARQNAITQAIQDFYTQYGRLPCAADPSLPSSSANFGMEAVCTAGAPPAAHIKMGTTPLGNRPPAPVTVPPEPAFVTSDGNVWIGAVPVRTLGLDDSYIANPSNYLYIYAVTAILAAPLPANMLPPLLISTPQPYVDPFYATAATHDVRRGMIDIQRPTGPGTGISILGKPYTAIYAVISPGKAGNGAWVLNGSAPTPCMAGTNNYQNCLLLSGPGDPNKQVMFFGGSGTYSGN